MELHMNKRVVVGFTVSIAALMILAFYSYYNNQQFIQAQSAILHTTEALYHIEQAKSNSIKIEELVAWYMLTGNPDLLKNYNNELEQATVHYIGLKKLTIDNTTQQIRLDSLAMTGRKKLDLHQKFIEARTDSGKTQLSATQIENNRNLSGQLNAVIEGLLAEENSLLSQRLEQGRVKMIRFNATFISLIVVILAILASVFIVINRTLKAKILAEKKAVLVNQELEAFTYSVSHDLRAPLRSILGFSQVLKEDYHQILGSEGTRVLEKVMRNARQMGQLIDDLLDFARIGRKEMFMSSINVQLQVDEVINEITDSNPHTKNIFTIKELPEMRGDINMMKQVWVNLISNAVKYSQKITDPKIEIGSTQVHGENVFYVKDNGVGFDMQYYEKLFNVFQRLHANSEFEGTGVGLALVHRIVSRHHGKIWAEAKPNEGATFYFVIPN